MSHHIDKFYVRHTVGTDDPPLAIDLEHPDANNVEILLNGEQLTNCVAADVLGMWVKVICKDDDGRFMHDDDDCPIYEKLVGRVEIRWGGAEAEAEACPECNSRGMEGWNSKHEPVVCITCGMDTYM